MNGSLVARLVESLGWTLSHFVWQGALAAAALYCLLTVARRASAQLRYLAACAALLLASIAAPLTFVWELELAESPATRPAWVSHDSADRLAGDMAGRKMASGSPAAWRGAINGEAAEAGRVDGRGSDLSDGAWRVLDFGTHDFGFSPDRVRSWLPTIVALWATGVGLLSLRLLAGWRTIRRLRTTGCEIDDPEWIERFAQMRGRLGVSRPVRLLASASATVPFVVGWMRPVVLVPASLLVGLNAGELEAIFAHELAHIRRHDFVVNLLQNVIETLLFYHPAIWWISAQIRKEREHCCDDVAAAVCGGALGYAKALVALEQLRPASELMVAASGGSLLRRIRRLASSRNGAPNRSAWPLPALVLFLGAAIAVVAVGRSSVGEQNDQPVMPAVFKGPEIIAWVGPEAILASDVLPDANHLLQKIMERAPQPPSAEDIERLRKLYMSKFLERVIETKMVVVEGRRSLPKEAREKIEKQFHEQFDKEYLPKMLDSEQCRSRTELDMKLRKQGSSLESVRRQAMENSFAQHWLAEKLQGDHELTEEEIAAGQTGGKRQEYLAGLRKRIPVWTIFAEADNDPKPARDEAETEPVKEPAPASPAPNKKPADAAADAVRTDLEIVVIDAATGQPVPQFRVLAGVKSGAEPDEPFKSKHPGVTPAAWQPHTIQSGERGALRWKRLYDDEMILRVEADGYRPQTSDWFAGDKHPAELKFELVADAGFRGQVLMPDGQPAADATLAIALPQRTVKIEEGHIWVKGAPEPENERDRWQRPTLVKADMKGRFLLPAETDPTAAVLVVHESGALDMSYADFCQQPVVTLRRWGRIEGQVRWQGVVGADEPIAASVSRNGYGYPDLIGQSVETISNAEGKFVVDKLLPGSVEVSRVYHLRQAGPHGLESVNFDHQFIEVGATEKPSTVLVGGQGRTVKGRLTGRDAWDGVTIRFLPGGLHIGLPGDEAIWEAHCAWASGRSGKFYFREKIAPHADGSFELSDVLPGDYKLIVFAADSGSAVGGAHIDVQAEPADEMPPTLEVGEIKVGPAEKAAQRPAAIEGIVLRPDGKPAVGAMVAIATPEHHFSVVDGEIRADAPPKKTDGESGPPSVIAVTDAEGRFTLPAATEQPATLVAAHATGGLELPEAEFKRQTEFKLLPWGRVEGVVSWRGQVGADELIDMSIYHGGNKDVAPTVGRTSSLRSDAEGKFVFDKVLPGEVYVRRKLALDKKAYVTVGISGHHLDVKPGEATPILIGGVGRTVTGRLAGRDSWEGVTVSLAVERPPFTRFPFSVTQAMSMKMSLDALQNRDLVGEAFDAWRKGPVGPLFFHAAAVGANGSFEIPAVLPGIYTLSVAGPGIAATSNRHRYVVELETAGETPPPVDLGEFEVPGLALRMKTLRDSDPRRSGCREPVGRAARAATAREK